MQELYQEEIESGQLTEEAGQRAVLPILEQLLTQLQAARPSGLRNLFSKEQIENRGLYLWGGVGRGKSMLMDMFVSAAQVPKRRVHFHAFMQEIHASLHEMRRLNADDAIKPVAKEIAGNVRLLAFDEMQINDITDAMIVGRLFEYLMDAGVTIVTTSNRAPDDLYKNGLNRQLFVPFIDLLTQRMIVHHLASPTDFRQDQLAGTQVYFQPFGETTRTKLDALWIELTGGVSERLVLRVKGRDLVLDSFHNGVARVKFRDVCGKPLGAADYLTLAENVRVLILENVPRLDRSNFNEAKRFVMLIDTLYEARVKLIISAADIPERLYLEGEGSFEFERTASRLVEMQGDAWGA